MKRSLVCACACVSVCVYVCVCVTVAQMAIQYAMERHTLTHIQRTLIAKASSHNSHMLFSTTLTQIANNKNSKYRTVQKAARVAVVLLPSCCYSVYVNVCVCVFGCV